jgi:hypothetical protein
MSLLVAIRVGQHNGFVRGSLKARVQAARGDEGPYVHGWTAYRLVVRRVS